MSDKTYPVPAEWKSRAYLDDTTQDELARTLVHDKYAHGDDLASWRESALPIAIDLTPTADQP